ncbi:ATP-binding protein [Limobrevibacterium gyesilva]|uniref:ATP-binding protein n=1 Tax=Limobrevibacterium gyesilva TaxID=2991712 RepID=A0AA41YM81_9PROT|nr:ATP-binding protein [Limobrevibacterium gyesilva]MCW3475305.1 ATP-binding protein [Limobrevibacterium gyesilva]
MAAAPAPLIPETAPDAQAPDRVLALIVARVRMALQGEAGPARAALEAALGGPAGARRLRMAEVFGLSNGAMDLLDLALALAADPGLAEAYATAQGASHRVCPTEALAQTLFGADDGPVWRAGAALSIWGLLVPIARTAGEPDAFEADPRVVDWLRGVLGLDAPLVGRAHLIELHPPFAAWPVAATARDAARATERSAAVRVVVAGPTGSGRASFAAVVASAFRRRALAIDAAGAEDFPDLLMRARRLARMADLALVWRDHEGIALSAHPQAAPLEFVTTGPRARATPVEGTADLVVKLPQPTRDERRELWRRLVPSAAAWPAASFDALTTRPGVTVGDIVAVAHSAPDGPAQAADRLRARARARLGEVSRALTPRLRWDDLVLPALTREALEEIAFEAGARARLLAEPEPGRLYARGGGLAVLFSGPPGTGKTMAAEAIADSLGADLLVVDLAATVSKYIGETAKNLSRVFEEAASSGAILLFDEADALFAKRSEIKDSHDRYANTDTNHLLQLLEVFDGLAILATNRRSNMDPAFVRRIRHVVEFARPGAVERRTMWRRAVAALAGAEHTNSLATVLDAFADQHELTAAQIKNAALTARYAAMRDRCAITQAHLQRGLARELAKDGRPVDAPARPTRDRHA